MPDTQASNEAVATQAPPVAMSDAELERLLDEATSLSLELSEEVGDISNEAPAEEGAAQEEAVAQAADVADEPEPQDAAPPAVEEAKPLPDLLQDPDEPTAAAPAEVKPEPTTDEDAAPETRDPAPALRPSVKIETRDEEIAANASAELVEGESGESEDPPEEEGRPHSPSVKERLVASCRLAMRLGRAVPIGVANACLTVFVILDHPFRDVSPGLKRALGLIALATLVAGIVTWILPDVMNSNPFAEMERHTKIRG